MVEDSQLSLAIGKKGQNVRLAAKLTGWKIDIKSEEEKRREVEAELGALEARRAPSDDAGADGRRGAGGRRNGGRRRGAAEAERTTRRRADDAVDGAPTPTPGTREH